MTVSPRGHIAAIDVGATKTLVTLRPLPLVTWEAAFATLRIPTDRDPVGLVEAIADLLTGPDLGEHRAGWGSLRAVGWAAPGPLDRVRGTVIHSPNLGWHDVALVPLLRERLDVPVTFDDDANFGALGEYALGAGSGADPMAYVTVSTGIGSGIVVHGEIVHGARGIAGEVGHLVVEPGGSRCSCGRRGCAEAFASGWAFERPSRRRSRSRPVDPGLVFRAAERGDDEARTTVQRGEAALARVFAALQAVLDPERIVVGGSLARNQPRFIRRAAARARRLCMPESGSALTVVPAALGDESVLAGAAVAAARMAETDRVSEG